VAHAPKNGVCGEGGYLAEPLLTVHSFLPPPIKEKTSLVF
jgi:hypothetical protein